MSWLTEVDFVTPPFDISDKLMRHSLFEPPIVPEFPWQFFSNSVDAILRNHVIKFWKFMVKSSYLGYLRWKLLFGEILLIYQKNAIFTVDTLNMTIFIIISIFPMIRCIDSSLKKKLSEKNFLAGNTLYMILDQKFLSTEILKNCLLFTSKGHLGSY